MNAPHPTLITEEGPKVDVPTGIIEDPNVARQRAINEATGSSILLPPPVIITPATWDSPTVIASP